VYFLHVTRAGLSDSCRAGFRLPKQNPKGVLPPFGRESCGKAEGYFFLAGFFVTFFAAGAGLAASLPPMSVNESVALNG
jgi:hypothetical protein